MTARRNGSLRDCVVVAMARTPFGRFGGTLQELSTTQLGALAIDETIRRAAVDADNVDSLHAGVGMIGGGVLTPARRMVLQSRLRDQTPSLTVDRACCSGMTAIGLAMRELAAGEAQLVLAGGAESLSNTPKLLPRSHGIGLVDSEATDPLALRAPFIDGSIATYTGQEALRQGVDRAAQDAWALHSHERYFAAEKAGFFIAERFPVETPAGPIETDESPRSDTSLAKLAALKTIYGSPTVTAGNAPGLNDGAAFVMLASRVCARRLGLPILAKLEAYAQVAGRPTSGTTTPAEAIMASLQRANRHLMTVDLIEINEAYAATPLVSTLHLAKLGGLAIDAVRERTNVHGGAVAIGHPLGASGARIVMTLINGLTRRGGGRGVAAICGGFGQGDALLVEVDERSGTGES